ncbi:hypothetical protein ACIPW5_11260 [Streptomyces sp. NPDC090077]|uniref:hypothetical protein n=1 Tax=Streptomyces sp. NPDC090077 TaxID=3365938 RepID=UPI0037FD0483
MTAPYPADDEWVVERLGERDWLVTSAHYESHDRAAACLAERERDFPGARLRILRITTTYTVEPA